MTSTSPKPLIELISYNKEKHDRYDNLSLDEIFTKLPEDRVNWINIDGLNNQDAIEKVQAHFNLHSLLIEDVLSDQRPKAEEFEGYLFFTLKMLYRFNGKEIDYEQISFVLGTNYLITFQEKKGDLFDGFRERIRLDQGRVRKRQADYLLYRLLDIIIDNYYNILDHLGDIVDEIEETVYEDASNTSFQKIQKLKKELIYIRKALYPTRDALSKVVKGESEFVRDENSRFFMDVYDHVVHILDSVDTYKDLTSSLLDIHMNAMNNKMNEVMKVLTVISTIFIPLTFVVGVYGMNFDFMPELRWKYGYYAVWGVMGLLVFGMLGFFRYKKWF
jgi:magnesium transporter